MASVSVLEEGSCALKSGNIEIVKSLYERVSNEIKSVKHLEEGDHLRLLKNKGGLSRCFEVGWCILFP